MKLAIGSDHAGFEFKKELTACLRDLSHDVPDVGTQELVAAFVNAAFTNEERHVRRFNKVRAIESNRSTAA